MDVLRWAPWTPRTPAKMDGAQHEDGGADALAKLSNYSQMCGSSIGWCESAANVSVCVMSRPLDN